MKIGIVGGGQLGLMIAEAANKMGHSCMALDPAVDAPAFAVCEDHIVAAYDDVEALRRLCEASDVITYEFENIPAEVLEPLCEEFNIKQGCKPLLDSQDRLREKDNARANGLTPPKYAAVDDMESLQAAIEMVGLPAVLKSRRMGYDGRGQAVLRTAEDVAKAADLLDVPSILEEFITFDYEVSTVVVRTAEGAEGVEGEGVTIFPVGQNIHKRGVLDLSIVPAPKLSEEMRKSIEQQSVRFMQGCGYFGILAIEYFIRGEEVLFNEMAPRPHNSGHYTIEGCSESQFSELVRFLVGEPLKGAELVGGSVVMKNILGEDYAEAQSVEAECERGEHSDTYVHIYGKSECKVGRKMAHITFVGMDQSEFNRGWSPRFGR